jgi:hypothetical protein
MSQPLPFSTPSSSAKLPEKSKNEKLWVKHMLCSIQGGWLEWPIVIGPVADHRLALTLPTCVSLRSEISAL